MWFERLSRSQIEEQGGLSNLGELQQVTNAEYNRRNDAWASLCATGMSPGLLGGSLRGLASVARQQQEQRAADVFNRAFKKTEVKPKPKGVLAKLKADFKEWTEGIFDFSDLKDIMEV